MSFRLDPGVDSVRTPSLRVDGYGYREPRAVSATRYEQRHATVLGMRLRYIDVGKPNGELPLLLLHGLASRIEEYDTLIQELKIEHRRVIAFDMPGNGYSDKPDRRYSLQLMEDAALALLNHLEIDHANLAGGSLGGNLTLRLARRQPDRFEKLAAWAPAGAWNAQVVWPQLLQPLRLLGSLVFWPMMRVQSRFWYHPMWEGRARALADAFAHFREVYCKGFVRMYFDLGYEQITTSLFPIAPRIKQPTLLLWGDQDNGMNMGAGIKRLRGMLPNARLVVFPNARHSLAAEIPQKLAASIDSFLAA